METNKELELNNGENVPPPDTTNTISATESEVANIIVSEFQQSLEGENVAMVEATNILTEDNDSAASEPKDDDMEVDEPIVKELEQVREEPMLVSFNESNEDTSLKQDESGEVAMTIEQIPETVDEIPNETIVETEVPHQEHTVQHEVASEQHEASIEQHVVANEQHEASVEQHEASVEQHEASVEQHEESIEQHEESIEQHEESIEQHEESVEQHEESIEQHEASVEQYEVSLKDETSVEQLESSTEQHEASVEQHEETVLEQMDQSTEQITEIIDDMQETVPDNIQVIEGEIEDHKDIVDEEHEHIEEATIIKVDECKASEESLYNQESNGTEDEEEELEEYEEITQEGTVLVVASGEPEMKEIVVRTPDGREGTVTVQQVTDENGQVYLVETMDNVIVMDEDGSHHVEHVENAPRPKVPSHVLGRNIENPSVDPFRNGKAPPKPRLGVKIPYRNLTSQIVSKQEITAEIMERSKRCSKQSPSGQNLFAKRLTQTLAKKLAPSKKKSVEGSTPHIIKKEQFNNSDLIAILEGDGDDPEPEIEAEPEVPEPEEPFIMTKEMERAIALKQLRELPDDPPVEAKRPVPPKKDEFTFSKEDDIEKSLKQIEEVPNLRKIKRNRTDLAREEEDDIPKPTRFTSSVPLKTYTRKRKQSEEVIPEPKSNVPSPTKPVSDSTKKIDLPSNSKNYITKSSRIIKKKIIWDPDEVSPKKMLKTGENNKDRLITVVRKEVSNEDKKLVAIKKLKEEELKKADLKKCEKNEIPKKADGSKKLQTSPKMESPKPEKKILVKAVSPHKLDNKMTNEKLAALKGKKRPTEVDKLLMDEGAVNMLYSFKNSEDDSRTKKVNKSLMSKTNELLNDLQTNTDKVSPKALRKKDGTPIQLIKTHKKSASPAPITAMSRQKSRDSVRSSIYSSPGSPGSNADASRIIRRHSSSSFSSEDENDSDMEDDEEIKEKVREVREVRAIRRKADTSLDTIKKRRKEKDDSHDIDHNEAQFNKLVDSDDDKYDDFKTFTVKKVDQVVEIILHCNDKDNVYLKIEMMQEISIILKELEQDADCNVAYITSSGNSFMKGIKYKSLVAQKEVTRKNLAKKMATSVRDFLLALANFPKLIVAGVHGNNIGLGVTMLPLFDMVVSNSSATFHIPNADIGCMAEGGSLLLLPHLSQNVLISELLFVSQKLEASEALKLGLVSKVLETETFEESVNTLLTILSTKSAQFMEATKKQLRNRMIPDITAALNSETENLVQQWISSECQKNFSDI
ncbi:PREDICTED: golgin subfamily B member 1 [Nicrophorus vespilloides]|uniref:Golgin subfamily B member 1 n=1 Tax=Nicrophorus vespilloides TaxID=110193 RepID=A0ABM1N3W3_NICVS|nr:PREDICTED: golgin subfamily B member 1 [Nicrophorus vespilloides]